MDILIRVMLWRYEMFHENERLDKYNMEYEYQVQPTFYNLDLF